MYILIELQRKNWKRLVILHYIVSDGGYSETFGSWLHYIKHSPYHGGPKNATKLAQARI